MSAKSQSVRNPFGLLLCDTDALIQVFCGKQDSLLRKLRTMFDIQCGVVEAVEEEMMRPGRRRADCCQQSFQKAINSGEILVLDRTSISKFTSSDPFSVYDAIQLRGRSYESYIDRGEAYTHAAATILRAAVMSNDISAVKRADRANLALGDPTVRAYDLFILFHQRGDLSSKEVDAIRKTLVAVGDGPHDAFGGCSFAEGLQRFYPRLMDAAHPLVGSSVTRELGDQKRVFLHANTPRTTSEILTPP